MNRLLTITLCLGCILLTGCEALSKGKFMQWDDSNGLSLAVVSLHVEGHGTSANTPKNQELTRAMLKSAEKVLATKFAVLSADKFVGDAAYRAKATANPVANTVSPTVQNESLATFTADPDMLRKGRVPDSFASHLATDLDVKYVAVIHTKWYRQSYDTGQVLVQDPDDGALKANTSGIGLMQKRQGTFAATSLTIYNNLGRRVVSEHRIVNGGYEDVHQSILRAFRLGMEQVADELHSTASGIEHRPK